MRFIGWLRLVLFVGLSVNVGLTVLLASKWWDFLVPSAVAVGSFSSALATGNSSRDWVSNGRGKESDPENATKTKKETGEQACVRNSACELACALREDGLVVLVDGRPVRRPRRGATAERFRPGSRCAVGLHAASGGDGFLSAPACPTACMLWCAVNRMLHTLSRKHTHTHTHTHTYMRIYVTNTHKLTRNARAPCLSVHFFRARAIWYNTSEDNLTDRFFFGNSSSEQQPRFTLPYHGDASVLDYRQTPAFLDAVDDIDSQMITLVTQCSMDRLPQLKEQALAYANAPISVAVYIPFDRSEVTLNAPEDFKELRRIRRFHQTLATEGARRVTISLLFGNAPSKRAYDDLYPVNALRNVALKVVKTDLVFLVDVDFVPSPQLTLLGGGLAYDTYLSV